MTSVIQNRRASSDEKFVKLKNEIQKNEIHKYAKSDACLYVTGSYARGEASNHSDVDLFILGLTTKSKIKDEYGADIFVERRSLSRLNEICTKAVLIQSTRNLGITEFSGDGKYLAHYTTSELLKTLGHPTDDSLNTFTARLLLLLESKPLYGEKQYRNSIDEVIAEYWKDYQDHSTEFIPAFLANDILRLWRTFCVNYEARTNDETEDQKAERKLANYKLKHSRLLTCFSSLVYMLALYQINNTVTIEDAINLSLISPTERLASVSEILQYKDASNIIDQINIMYGKFLNETDSEKYSLREKFKEKETSKRLILEAYNFGDKVHELLEFIRSKASKASERFYRILVV